MHEASLMRDLMARILAVAEKEAATRVCEVTVWLGALSHMSPEHFGEHYAIAAHGTIAEGARIVAVQSDDMADPNAQGILLKSIAVE